MSDASRPNPTSGLIWLGGASTILSLLLAVGVGWWQPWLGWGLAVAVVLGGAALWVVRARRVFGPIRAAVGSVPAILLIGVISFGSFAVLPSLRVLAGIIPRAPLAEVGHLDEGIYHLEGAALRPDLVGTHTYRKRLQGMDTTYLVAMVVVPLVDEGWTKSSPVPAWAAYRTEVHGSVPAATAKCLANLRGVIERGAVFATDEYSPAIAIALKTHGLQQLAGAPAVELPTSPQNAWFSVALLVAGLMLVLFLYGKLSRRERGGGAATP